MYALVFRDCTYSRTPGGGGTQRNAPALQLLPLRIRRPTGNPPRPYRPVSHSITPQAIRYGQARPADDFDVPATLASCIARIFAHGNLS
jgi:hypothetical protein